MYHPKLPLIPETERYTNAWYVIIRKIRFFSLISVELEALSDTLTIKEYGYWNLKWQRQVEVSCKLVLQLDIWNKLYGQKYAFTDIITLKLLLFL